ncbi:hypothetical protein EZS27_024394 [termite gut metagenome]|uniref:Uncharacterized protein n=1 Tax=termite gut metagenome TaxID=433724 RepID=A0A5J4QYX7_9ZZZZ
MIYKVYGFKNKPSSNLSRSFEPVSDLPSLTVPDQAISIPDLLEKYVNGTLLPCEKTPYYADGDVSFDDFNPTLSPDFDLVDAQLIKEDLEARFAELDAQKKAALQKDADDVKAKLIEYERIKALYDERSEEEKPE